MRCVIGLISMLLLASSVFAGGMLKHKSIELGGSFSLSVQDGERYDDIDGKSRTIVSLAAEPGGFFKDGILVGGYFGWQYSKYGSSNSNSLFDIGPRMAIYFTPSSKGSAFAQGSIRLQFDDQPSTKTTTIPSLGFGYLFPVSSRAGVVPTVNWKYYINETEGYPREGYEIEFRIGFRIFHFRSSTATGGQS